jgi:hypothetical protein
MVETKALTLSGVLNTILSVKVLYLLLGIVGLVVLGLAIYGVIKIIQNIQAKQALKFAPLAVLGASISWKVILYVLVFAIASGTGIGIYKKLTQKAITTNYRNDVSKAQTVNIDQRQIFPDKKYLIRIELFGLDLHFYDVTPKEPVTIKNNVTTTPEVVITPVPVAPVAPKPVKKGIFTFFNILKVLFGLTIVVVGTHYVVKLIKSKQVKQSGK